MVREFMKGNRNIVDGKEIANSFNDFFTNIGPELAKKIDEIPGKSHRDFLEKCNIN